MQLRQSADKAAAFLQKDTHFCYTFKLLLSIINVLLQIKYEYAVSIGLCGSGFEAGLSTAAPAAQLHTFLSTKLWYIVEIDVLFTMNVCMKLT